MFLPRPFTFVEGREAIGADQHNRSRGAIVKPQKKSKDEYNITYRVYGALMQ